MLELIWIEDEREARSEQTRRTRLWERWSQAGGAASPFGIILRPSPGAPNVCPFPHWDYRSPLMPDLQLQVAAEGGLEEPMWFYMTGGRPLRVSSRAASTLGAPRRALRTQRRLHCLSSAARNLGHSHDGSVGRDRRRHRSGAFHGVNV